MKSVALEVLSTPNCQICKQFEDFWQTIAKDWPNVTYKKMGVLDPEGQQLAQKYVIMVSPGIILNGELFSVGGFDKVKFVEKLQQLSV